MYKRQGATALIEKDLKTVIAELEVQMREAAANLEFEEAARLRDELRRLEAKDLGLDGPGMAKAAVVPRASAEIDAPVQPAPGRRTRKR